MYWLHNNDRIYFTEGTVMYIEVMDKPPNAATYNPV